MSRPPQNDPMQSSAIASRRGVIDFVSVPVNAQHGGYSSVDDHYIQSLYPPQGPMAYMPTSLAAAAPMPVVNGGVVPMPAGMAMAAPYPPTGYVPAPYPAMPSAYMAAPYFVPAMQQQDPNGSQPLASKPQVTEDGLREKINSKIDSILEMQKTDMLSSRIERLTDKVQKLSRNIEAHGAASGYTATESIKSGDEGGELKARLKRLAAESGKRAARAQDRENSVPDW